MTKLTYTLVSWTAAYVVRGERDSQTSETTGELYVRFG